MAGVKREHQAGRHANFYDIFASRSCTALFIDFRGDLLPYYGVGGWLDFHYKGTADYTSRIIEDIHGRIFVYSNLDVNGDLGVNGNAWFANDLNVNGKGAMPIGAVYM
jgi:hypothetical protein